MHSNTNRLSLGWFTIKNDVDISFFIYDLLQNKEIDQMRNDLKNRQIIQNVPNGIQDFELVYENKDFELRRLQ